MPNQRQIIVLTGVPGVGKTTIARSLMKRIGGTSINLSELAVREGLIIGEERSTDASIVNLEEMRKKLLILLKEGKEPLIIEGHLATEVVPEKCVYSVFVLRRAPWIIKEELTLRRYPEGKVEENVEAELLDVCLVEALEAFGSEKICEIDTTERTPEEVVKMILEILNKEKPCPNERIDWLGRPESVRMLEG